MSFQIKEILKILFPEYQIKACIDERGLIAKNKSERNHAASGRNISRGNVQMQAAPSTSNTTPVVTPIQQAPAPPAKTMAKGYVPTKDIEKVVNRASDSFDSIAEEMKRFWVGTDEDRSSLVKAFQRPYVKGFSNNKPKNSILILGTESRGKVYAVQCISKILQQKKVFRYSEISRIDMKDYASDTSNALFLSDLFKALNMNTETIVFDSVDKSSIKQLDIIYQLLTEGTYKLSKRYMASNGSLVEATGVLNTELISEIPSNGKYFVMTSELSQAKIISILGNKIVKELGDIITFDPIDDKQVRNLAYTLLINLTQKCKKHLHIDVEFDALIVTALSRKYSVRKGVKGLEDYIDQHLYEPLSEMKLQDILWDDERINLTYEGDYCAVLKGGEKVFTSKYLRNFNSAQLEVAKKELEQVIGLKSVKDYVLNLETNLTVQKMREDKGLNKSEISMHMIFVGNPGTGKTTIARIVAKYLKAIGVLSSGHLSEVTRADLVGQYAGHTAVKTTEVINSAIGGVLFIDEAYSLCRDKNDIFGLEAIDALVKGMEDNRDDLVVILAGYEDEMKEFLKANSGLKSRFPNIVHFEDYTVEEMYEIAEATAKSKGYKLASECKEGLLHVFEKHQIKGKNDSGNGRLVRNIIEAAVLNQSKRIVNNPEDDMEMLIASDFGFDKTVGFDLEKSLADVIGMDEVKKIIRT